MQTWSTVGACTRRQIHAGFFGSRRLCGRRSCLNYPTCGAKTLFSGSWRARVEKAEVQL